MEYRKVIVLKDGRECILRSAAAADAKEVLDVFIRTHAQTEFLSTYPDEIHFTAESEAVLEAALDPVSMSSTAAAS